jgi:hypothetical protein
MSKEEAIRLLKESGAINWPGGPAWSIRVDDAERLIALARAPQDGWVSVAEQMPEDGTECLVATQGGVVIDTWRMQREAPLSFSSATIEFGLAWDSFPVDGL